MADIAEIGFRADTSELVDAKARLEALAPSAGKAEKASERMGKMLDRAGMAADKLLSAATGLGGVVDRLTNVLTAQASAAQQAAAGLTTVGTASAMVTYSLSSATTITLNAATANKTLATSTVAVATGAQQEASAVMNAANANDRAAGTAKISAAANDNLAGSYKRAASNAEVLATKAAAISAVKSGDFFNARDRGADIAAYGAEMDRLRAKFNPLFAVMRQYDNNVEEIRQANRVGAISVMEMNEALIRQRAAANTAIASIRGGNVALNDNAVAHKRSNNAAYANLNVIRQFSDVGVTAAMGMSPFMILIQQGPQIFDVFQQRAIETGTTVKAAMLAMGRSAVVALAPLLAFLIPLAIVIGTVAAAFALGARSINQDNQNIVESLGLTEKQLERVKKSGVDTAVTMGDVWGAFWEVLGERAASRLTWLTGAFSTTFDAITGAGKVMAIAIVAGLTGAMQAIVNAWSLFPQAIGSFLITAANYVRSATEAMINGSIGLINMLVNGANGALAALGADTKIPLIGDVSIDQLANPYEGAGRTLGTALKDGFLEGVQAANAGMNKFFDDVSKRAVKNRTDLIKTAAGDPEKTPKGPKSDAEKFSDIVNGAERTIAALKAERDGIGLTAEETARLKRETELLNDAKQKNITLTPAMRSQLMALAGTMANLDTEIKNLKGFKDIKDGAAATLTGLQQQQAMLGLNADQMSRLKYQNELLNAATAKGITLSAGQRDELMATATEMANTEIAIRNTNTAIELQRDVTKGFVSDLRTNLAQGQSLFHAFTNAVVSALNKVTDKLMEVATNSLFSGGGSSGGIFGKLLGAASSAFGAASGGGFAGSGLSSAITGAGSIAPGMASIGMLPGFAKGAAFGGSGVVSTPTMFKFAKGAALGEMGEAGPEAIMPLARGPNGSLGVQMHGGGSNQPQRVELIVRAEEGAMFRPVIEEISQNTGTQIVSDALSQYNEALPTRVHEISNDARVR